MGALMNYRQTEMWANNKLPYFATYAPNGVAIYPAQDVGTPKEAAVSRSAEHVQAMGRYRALQRCMLTTSSLPKQGLPWKRREFFVTPPDFEGTRFRFTTDEFKERTTRVATTRSPVAQGVRQSQAQGRR